MSFPERLRSMLVDVSDALGAAGIRYMIMGGIAVPVWGIPHTTYDIDFTRSWADRLGIRERLEKMLRETAEGAPTGGPASP